MHARVLGVSALALYKELEFSCIGSRLDGYVRWGTLQNRRELRPFYFLDATASTTQVKWKAPLTFSAFLSDSSYLQAGRRVTGILRQDRYSIRIASQWLGPVLEDLILAYQQLSMDISSTPDNFLVDAVDKRILFKSLLIGADFLN